MPARKALFGAKPRTIAPRRNQSSKALAESELDSSGNIPRRKEQSF